MRYWNDWIDWLIDFKSTSFSKKIKSVRAHNATKQPNALNAFHIRCRQLTVFMKTMSQIDLRHGLDKNTSIHKRR